MQHFKNIHIYTWQQLTWHDYFEIMLFWWNISWNILLMQRSSILFFMPKCFHVRTTETAILLLLSLNLIFMRPCLYMIAQEQPHHFSRKTKSKHNNILYLWQVIIETSRVMMICCCIFSKSCSIFCWVSLNPRSFCLIVEVDIDLL